MTDLPNYPSRSVDDPRPKGTDRRPASVRLARWTAAAQAVTGAGAAAWSWRQAAAITPAGDDDWSQIPQTALRFGGVVVAMAALAVAVPAVLLGRPGPAPRTALIVTELAVGVPLLLVLPASLGATGQAGLKVLVTAALIGVVTTVVAATRPAAREWSADRYRG